MGGFGDFFKGAGGGLISGAFDLAGGALSSITGNKAQEREYARQKEFAQNGIRWRVEDAKAAGIHPIYAIGANTPTYSPQAAVGTDFGVSQMGQSIGRAIEAKQTASERAEATNIANQVGRSQAEYYSAAAANQRAQADLAGQRAVAEALSDIGREYTSGMAARSDRVLRNQPAQPPVMPKTTEGIWGSDIPELSKVYAPDGRISALIISDKLHDAVEDIHLFESVPYIINGVQVGWKILNAKKDGAEFYGYRWHDDSKQWIKNPNWRMPKPLSYDEAFNRHGYGYSKNRSSYHGRIR